MIHPQGPPNINAEPRKGHFAFDCVNRKFAGHIAASCLRRALDDVEAAERLAESALVRRVPLMMAQREAAEQSRIRLDRLLDTISSSGLPYLRLDLHGRESFTITRPRLHAILQALPPELEHLWLQLDLDKCHSRLFLGREKLVRLDLSGCGGLQSSVDGSGFRDADYLFRKLRHLATLEMRNCPDLDMLPEKLSDLPSLTTLDVSHCPRVTTLPSKLPATLKHIILTGTPITHLGSGIGTLRRLQPLVGLGQELVQLPNLSFFMGKQLDLQPCVELYSTEVDEKTDRELTQLYKKHPFDASAWLRLVYPWVVVLEKTRGVSFQPPRFDSSLGAEEMRRVDETLQHLIDEVRNDTVERSKKMALKLNQRALLSPRVNRMRAATICRSETRKHSSLEELRLEAERMVRLSAGSNRPAWEKSTHSTADASEQSAAVKRIQSRLDELDLELFERQFGPPKAAAALPILGAMAFMPRRGSRRASVFDGSGVPLPVRRNSFEGAASRRASKVRLQVDPPVSDGPRRSSVDRQNSVEGAPAASSPRRSSTVATNSP